MRRGSSRRVDRGAGSLLKLVEPTGRGVWERESPSAVEMDPTCAHFDDMFRECLLAKIGPLICCHFVLSIVFNIDSYQFAANQINLIRIVLVLGSQFNLAISLTITAGSQQCDP